MRLPNPRIIFLTGLDKSALLARLISESWNIVALVTPKSKKYEPKYSAVVELARARGIPVITVESRSLPEALRHLEFDVLVSSGYPFKITREVFERAKFAINFHPALLPRHRGRYFNYILTERDEESGVTAHLIDEGYDTGPIVAQKSFPVSPFDTIYSLIRKSNELELGLVGEVLSQIREGSLVATPQDEAKATDCFKKRTPEDSEIDPSKPLSELFFEIRASDFDLFPAFFYVDGQKVAIKLVRKDKPETEKDMI